MCKIRNKFGSIQHLFGYSKKAFLLLDSVLVSVAAAVVDAAPAAHFVYYSSCSTA